MEEQVTEQLTEEQEAQLRIRELAKEIKNEKQLRKILMNARFDMRILVYNQIRPHLSFSPREYRKLMKHGDRTS